MPADFCETRNAINMNHLHCRRLFCSGGLPTKLQINFNTPVRRFQFSNANGSSLEHILAGNLNECVCEFYSPRCQLNRFKLISYFTRLVKERVH